MTDPVELREALLARDYESILAATAALADAGDDGPPPDADPSARLFRGLALALAGDLTAGLPLLVHARENLSPETAQRCGCLSDLGLAHLLCGSAATAIDCFERHLAGSPDDAVTYGRLAAAYLAADDAERACEYYVEATRREPGRAEWHNNLAAVQLRLQRLDDALENYTIALDLDPDLRQAQTARERVLVALGQTDVVVDELAARLAEASRNAPLRFRYARALVQANRLPEALNALLEVRMPVEELVDEAPDDAGADAAPESGGGEAPSATAEPMPEGAAMIASAIPDAGADDDEDIASLRNQTLLRALLAEVFAERAMFPRAVLALDEILRLQPPNPVPYIAQKAGALTELGRYEAAEALLDEAEEAHGDASPLKVRRALLYCELDRYPEAEALQRDLLETYPGDAQLKIQLGQTLLWTGKLDEAAALYEEASRQNPMALAHMVGANHIPDDPAAIEKMSGLADNVMLPDPGRITMSFALAEVYEKQKDFDRAFHYLKLANDLTDRSLAYSSEQFEQQCAAIREVFTADFFAAQPAIRNSDRTPVFVVGMPRSGTTLTEQILCSHPQVFGAGELPLIARLTRLMPRVLKSRQAYPHCLDAFTPHLREEAARFYLHGLDRFDEGQPYVVDKMPHNFMHVGLIRLILPRAKLIHIRRDPRDTALSNYQQNFKAKHGGLGYAFNLEKIAHEINSYHAMMEHWRTALPGYMLEITYEELVADQAAVARQMLDFVGLDWDENVTRFHETQRAVRTASVTQVRQQIYTTSRQKWRRYEQHLGPLLETLRPEVTALWDEMAAREAADR